jgi:hypothetical protein
VFFTTAYSQGKDNLVKDTTLSNKLRKYLIEHTDAHTVDSAGKRKPLNVKFIQEQYGDAMISSTNLKTDSVIINKKLIGVYAFRFADISSRPHLYIQNPNRIEFIDFDSRDFSIDALLKKIIKLFNKYPDQFTLQEKVKTIQGSMETLYYNKFAESSW